MLLTLALTALAFGQTTAPLLDTGLPNLASPPSADRWGQQHRPAAERFSPWDRFPGHVGAVPDAEFLPAAVRLDGAV